MFDYFKAELLRFRSWAVAYSLLHLAVLGFMCRVTDLAQQDERLYQLLGAVYLLSGLLFGAYQMGTYRKPNAWLHLLHRPLSRGRLASGLLLAPAVLLVVGVMAPLLMVAAWQELLTARVLDARHLGLPLSAWVLSVCGYLAGAFALLAGRRYAVAGLAALLVLTHSAAVGPGALAVQAAVALFLVAMVLAVFKPDLAAPPKGLPATLVVAFPLQASLWFGLMFVSVGFEMLWMLQGSHPNIMAVAPAGSVKEADRATGRELMIAGLQASALEDAALWREQAAISEIHTLRPRLEALPIRGQLTNPVPLMFEDGVRRTRWTFSHDTMRFEGQSVANDRAAGTLLPEGGHSFEHPPAPIGGGMVASRRAIHQFEDETGRLLPRAEVPADETVIGFEQVADRVGLLTSRALYLYDGRDLRETDGILPVRLRVPMPGRAGNLTRVELMELIDGVLVSFTFTRGRYDGFGTAFQEVVRVDEQGRVHPVARRDVYSGYPALFVYSHWYTSPLLYAVREWVGGLFAGYLLEEDAAQAELPRAALFAAVLLTALSVLAAAWRTREVSLSRTAAAAWLLACALVGLPAVGSLWLLYPRRERLDALPAASTVPA